jgi:hypothetical protein
LVHHHHHHHHHRRLLLLLLWPNGTSPLTQTAAWIEAGARNQDSANTCLSPASLLLQRICKLVPFLRFRLFLCSVWFSAPFVPSLRGISHLARSFLGCQSLVFAAANHRLCNMYICIEPLASVSEEGGRYGYGEMYVVMYFRA